jgi:hypothetical protein
MRAIDHKTGIWSLSLGQIEVTVAAHLGPGRVPGQEQHHCFSRQISMYLATHIGGWSTTKIGRFYNGRHHTTFCMPSARWNDCGPRTNRSMLCSKC